MAEKDTNEKNTCCADETKCSVSRVLFSELLTATWQ